MADQPLEASSMPDLAVTMAGASPHAGRPPVSLPADAYAVGAEIAAGGMGSILSAEDRKLGRLVAMKVMKLHATASAAARARFVLEAMVLARLEHPNIVPIHELGWDAENRLYYTMKLVHGRTLREVLDGLRHHKAAFLKHYTLDRLLTIFRKICDAMSLAHAKGVIHRDLKPENVMVGEFGEVLVMDWGLAKVQADATQSAQEAAAKAEATRPGSAERFRDLAGSVLGRTQGIASVTLDGEVVGTPLYMSPEQASGRTADVDEQSDVFSLGAILYAILTLRPPVDGETAADVMTSIRRGDIQPPTIYNVTRKSGGKTERRQGPSASPGRFEPLPHCPSHRVPLALSAVTMRALALEKSRRYKTVADFAADVEAYQGGFATRAEGAGLLKQLRLLVQRHRREFTIGFAAWLLISGLAVWFVLNLRASEKETRRQANIAIANEKRAVAQEEQTRRALGKSQVAVAEAAFRGGNLDAMVEALDTVPNDLRDQRWAYLSVKRDASLGELNVAGLPVGTAVAAVPGKPTQFVTADAAGNVGVVDVKTGQKLWSANAGFEGPVVIAVYADGTRLAVAARNGSPICILRTSDGAKLQTVPWRGAGIGRLALSPTADVVAVADAAATNAKIHLVDRRDGSIRWQIDGGMSDMVFSPDGTRLLVSGRQQFRRFRIVDVATGTHLVERDAYLYSLAMSLDGKLLALGYHGGDVAIVDVATGAELRRARLHQGEVTRMAWTAGGHLLTVGSEGGSEEGAAKGRRVMRLWETASFALRGTFFGLSQGGSIPPAWAFQPANGYLFTAENPPQLWHIPVDAEVARITCTSEQGWSVAFLSDTLLLGRKDYRLVPYDVSDLRSPRELPSPATHSAITCAVHRGTGVAAIARRINREEIPIRLYTIGSGDAALTLDREIAVPDAWTMRMDFDASGARLLAIYNGIAGAEIFSVATGESMLKLPIKMDRGVFAGTRGNVIGLVSKRGSSGEGADELTIFDGKTGQPVKTAVHRLRLNELVTSHDRRLVAVAGEEQVVRVLDADTLDERRSFRAHDGGITAMAFHPSLPILASAANDGTVKLWDYETGRLRQTFMGIDGAPVMLAFSPNGRLLALESQEHVVRVFDLEADVTIAALSPNGTGAAAAAVVASGTAHARAGRWAEARVALTEAVRLAPQDELLRMRLAVVLVQLGERAAHRALTREMLALYGSSDTPYVMERTAKAWCLLPLDDAEPGERTAVLRLADRAQEKLPKDLYLIFAKSLAHYRTGDFKSVAGGPLGEWEKVGHASISVSSGAVLAMAQSRLGSVDEARATLAVAKARAAEKLPKPGADLGTGWNDVVFAQGLLHEAEAIIGEQ